MVREAAPTYEVAAPPAKPVEQAARVEHVEKKEPLRYEIKKPSEAYKAAASAQLSLFDVAEHPLVEELRKLDVLRLTPLDAMNMLYQLHQKARGSE
jgi:DNA mismatch repair protein MutS